jgi:hypothetical protein
MAKRKKKKDDRIKVVDQPFEYDTDTVPVADTFNEEAENDKETRGMGYKEIADRINEDYDTDSTAQKIRDEMVKIVNKLFRNMISEHPTKLFQVVEVMAQEFHVDEEKIVRYLDKDNYNRLREFAKKNYNTLYWENMERRKKIAKARRKGKFITEIEETSNLFED